MKKLLLLGIVTITIFKIALCQPSRLFINLTQEPKRQFITYNQVPDKYFIILSSHDPFSSKNPALNSPAGHSWVLWGHQNPLKMTTEINGYGFWPDYDKIEEKIPTKLAGKLLAGATIIPTAGLIFTMGFGGPYIGFAQKITGAALGHVPGKLNEDLFNTPYSSSLKQIIFEVEPKAYNRSLEVLTEYLSDEEEYKLLENDCVTFFIRVGQSIGLKMPARSILSPSSWRPSDYMNLLMKSLSSKDGITLEEEEGNVRAKYGNIKVDKGGNYQVTFGYENENINVCTNDISGNIWEEKYRSGQKTSSEVTFPNADSWYQEFDGPNPNNFNRPRSEYQYHNGNRIVNYYPNEFTPNNASLVITPGSKTYIGSVNNEGFPNGIGTENTLNNNSIIGSSRTGIFNNGSFFDYTGIATADGMIFGELKEGYLEGKGRVEFNDGRIYTGTFSKGKANGTGTATNKNGDFLLNGNFKDGQASGFCTLSTRYGQYKGEIQNGQCNDNGTFYSVGGNIYEGKFKDGRLVDGKATLPNGNYYVGKFDINGRPSGGKYFDKNGKEISRERGESGEYYKEKDTVLKMGNDAGGWTVNGVRQ